MRHTTSHVPNLPPRGQALILLTEVSEHALHRPQAQSQDTGQILLTEEATLHKRLVGKTVHPETPQGFWTLRNQDPRVSLGHNREMHCNLTALSQQLAGGLVNGDCLVRDLSRLSSPAGLLIDQLLHAFIYYIDKEGLITGFFRTYTEIFDLKVILEEMEKTG